MNETFLTKYEKKKTNMHIIKSVSDISKALRKSQSPLRNHYLDNVFSSSDFYSLPKRHFMSLRNVFVIKPWKPSPKALLGISARIPGLQFLRTSSTDHAERSLRRWIWWVDNVALEMNCPRSHRHCYFGTVFDKDGVSMGPNLFEELFQNMDRFPPDEPVVSLRNCISWDVRMYNACLLRRMQALISFCTFSIALLLKRRCCHRRTRSGYTARGIWESGLE